MASHILTMGGGGFSMEPENLRLDRYLLSLSDRQKPKVCFIATASGDASEYIARFYQSMKTLECEPTHLALFKPPLGDLKEFVSQQDVFYVGGGNTRNLLVLWKEWGLDVLLKEASQRGAVLGGISAGSICWYEQGLTDSVTGKLLPLQCLGLLKGSHSPHYDGEAERRLAYQKLIQQGEMLDGLACDDGVAAHFIDGELSTFVSSRPKAKAYRVVRGVRHIEETQIDPEILQE